ncbi:tripartite tricarboxylate transporter substrate binding protein [Orrella sp. 11846]|uniref:tripartite tricarboxylate transporter substrate binding protein n=1 Tax=Orrella sp. 11846 TaxID=3409913 RepID=UPI003B5953D4
MRFKFKHFCVAFAAATVTFASHAAYPEKPIKLVVGFAPGGNTDVIARLVGQKLGEELGQAVVVENKAGAGGAIGTDVVSKSNPDGYTLLFGTSSFPIAASLYDNLPYDPDNSVTPVSLIAIVPLVAVVNPNVDAKTMPEFIEAVRKSPGTFNYGSAGVGSAIHLSVELLKNQENLDIVHIPYKGAGAAAPALIAGDVQLMIDGISTVAPNVEAGRLNALAVTSPERSDVLPDVPTFKELGLGDSASYIWNMVLVPKGTPQDVVDKIAAGMKVVAEDKEVQERFKKMGVQMSPDVSPEYANQFMDEELARWAKVIKEGNITVQ